MSTFSNIISLLNDLKKAKIFSEREINYLLEPKKVSYAELKVAENIYPAWRIISNNTLGPGKGGIRFHPLADEDEVKSLAFWMSLKNSLADLPYGGAKGAIRFNPKEKTSQEIEEISREYIRSFHHVLGENIDIPAPDIYTNSQIMAYMLDEFEKIKGYHEPAMITGKPLELGGTLLRQDATAHGGFIIIEELKKKFFSGERGLKVAIQGFGNAGSFCAQMMQKTDYKVVAISDSRGGIFHEDGLDIEAALEIKKKTDSLSAYESAEIISNEELLELDVDILVLAALENQITEENVSKVKAKSIVELANGPINYEADKILFEKGVIVVPDILANSGGVIASYFEWSQNKTGNVLDEDYLAYLLFKKMKTSWLKILDKYEDFEPKISLRKAAYIIALDKIIKTEKLRGRDL